MWRKTLTMNVSPFQQKHKVVEVEKVPQQLGRLVENPLVEGHRVHQFLNKRTWVAERIEHIMTMDVGKEGTEDVALTVHEEDLKEEEVVSDVTMVTPCSRTFCSGKLFKTSESSFSLQ